MITTATQHVHLEALWERIAIRPPYFAINDLNLDPSGVLSAQIPVQHQIEQEVGCISAAEVGRHLAVLGLCSIALQWGDAQKHYYLAQRAHLTRRGSVGDLLTQEALSGLAWPVAIDKRSAIARTQLLVSERTVLYELTVRYAVVGERLFGRMFSGYRQEEQETIAYHNNPYTKSLPLSKVKISGKRLTALLTVESPQDCVGHFPHYPSIPVAVLMQALGRASAQLIQELQDLSAFSYVVSDAEVRAENLAFSHEPVELVVDYLHGIDNIHVLSCTAMTNNQKEVGHVELTVQLSSPDDGTRANRDAFTKIGTKLV